MVSEISEMTIYVNDEPVIVVGTLSSLDAFQRAMSEMSEIVARAINKEPQDIFYPDPKRQAFLLQHMGGGQMVVSK